MLTNKIFRLLVVISVVVCFSCSQPEGNSAQDFKAEGVTAASPKLDLPFEKGETIKYAIKNLGINAGDATLTFHGLTKLNGKDVFLIVFRADAMNFLDEEMIYSDPQDFYPVFIKRNLNIWGKKEKIDEHYDSHKGIVRIVKHVGNQTQEQIIEKEGKIDNIYCFIYRYRKSVKFKIGDIFTINLPTTDVKIKLAKEANLKTAGRTFETYYMRSQPAKYQVWFGKGPRKIPLRIDGSVGVSATAMTMTDYKRNEKEAKDANK